VNKSTINLIDRKRFEDHRGWLLKVIAGNEMHLPRDIGEIYVTHALPAHSRGGHYHILTSEWFTVIAGDAEVLLEDPRLGRRYRLALSAANPRTLYVPAGIKHQFNCPGTSKMPFTMVAYSDRRYDPSDTYPTELFGDSPGDTGDFSGVQF